MADFNDLQKIQNPWRRHPREKNVKEFLNRTFCYTARCLVKRAYHLHNRRFHRCIGSALAADLSTKPSDKRAPSSYKAICPGRYFYLSSDAERCGVLRRFVSAVKVAVFFYTDNFRLTGHLGVCFQLNGLGLQYRTFVACVL